MAMAQGLFSPVVIVNGRAVTRYEIEQRVAFMRLLRTPGDLEKEAEEALIDDRLKDRIAREAGITLTPEELEAGMEEFVGRTGLDMPRFLAALDQAGIAPETFRDFVASGIRWRKFVQARFAEQARVTEAEVDQQMRQLAIERSARVLLSEIILPARPEIPGEVERTLQIIQDLRERVRTRAQFQEAVRQLSVAPSREQGGDIDWLSVENLPGPLVEIIFTLRPGEVSPPVPVGENALAAFRVRGIQEIGPRPASDVRVDYLTIALPGGAAGEARAVELAAIANGDCDALYPEMRRAGTVDALTRTTEFVRALPGGIALELAKLDPGEASATLTTGTGGGVLFLMLCDRARGLDDEEARQQAQLALFNRRLNSLSEAYLAAVRADAFITRN